MNLYNVSVATKKRGTREEQILDMAKSLLQTGGGEGEDLDHIKRVSTALQMTLLGVSYRMVERIEELLQLSDKVLEKLSDENNLNRMSPRSLVETLKSVSDIVNKYASYASSLHKEMDLASLEERLLEIMAKSRAQEEGSSPLSREELAKEILEVLKGKGVN